MIYYTLIHVLVRVHIRMTLGHCVIVGVTINYCTTYMCTIQVLVKIFSTHMQVHVYIYRLLSTTDNLNVSCDVHNYNVHVYYVHEYFCVHVYMCRYNQERMYMYMCVVH